MPVPEQYAVFPAINASLNGTSTVRLVAGRWLIARRRIAAHRVVMLTAVVTSSLFLISYLYYHYHVHSVHFQGTGWSRPVYYTILASHVPCDGHRSTRNHHPYTRPARPFRQTSGHRPLDVSAVALCLGHRCARILHAV